MKVEKHGIYINGNWVKRDSDYNLYSPHSKEHIATLSIASNEDVYEAIDSAKRASKLMKSLTTLERSQILEKVALLFSKKIEECIDILVHENAKPRTAARAELLRTIETYKFAAEEAKKISGETVPMDAALNGKDKFGFTKQEPLGVISAITPFNFPFNLVAHKLGPAFAMGNTVVLKPASQTPLSAIMAVKIFEEAGLPKGALNLVIGRGGEIGDILVEHPDIKMVTFTGSVEVGTQIRKKAGLKKVTLELGSNAAVIIDSADDLEQVAQRCAEGAFGYSGQACISVQRIYVQESIYETFIEILSKKTKQVTVGDPKEDDTVVSSLIRLKEAERVEQWIKEATGAEVLVGGKRNDSIIYPTILTNVTNEMKVSCKELFAPVVIVSPYDSFQEAIELVNDSIYGLQAGVYTKSIHNAFLAIDQLEVGGVIINDIPSFRVDHMPYGGVKQSGTGREGIKYSMAEMSELKFSVINL